jgi:phosphate transport system permease protein
MTTQSAPAEDTTSLRRRGFRFDFFRVLTWMASVATIITLLWIVASILEQALPAIQKTGLTFFTSSVWDSNREKFGAFPFLLGTAMSSLIALCFALPLGVAIAIFLSENFLAVPIRQTIRFVVELLAAIPSVVYGLWGIAVVIPLVQKWGNTLASALGFIPLFK